jgi:tetratricopeptide (TPR) repeat protein
MGNDSIDIDRIRGSVIGGKIEGTGHIVGQNVFVLTGSKDIEAVLKKIAATSPHALEVQKSGSSNQISNSMTWKEMQILEEIPSKLKEKENETGKKANEIRAGNVQLSREELLIKKAIIEGNRYVNIGKYEEAIESYDQALDMDPNYAIPWYNKGSVLDYLGKPEEAIESFDQALDIDPNYADAWNNKGIALGELGNYEEAIESFDQALDIDPNYSNAWYNKGNALCDVARYEEAIECYDQALDIDPNYAKAWNNKGNALYNLGRYEEATLCQNKARQLGLKA